MRKLLRRPNRALARDLETERFHLKSLGRLEALQVTNSWRHDPEILLNFYRSSRPRSVLKWLKSGLVPNNVYRFTFAIIPKEGGRPIGAHAIKLTAYRTASLTVALHDRDWWGKGVVLEVRPRLINHFFRHGEIDRFIGSVNGRNAASIFNYKRLGFDHVGTWHRHFRDPVTGEVIDVLDFELFRDKWEAGPWMEHHDGN